MKKKEFKVYEKLGKVRINPNVHFLPMFLMDEKLWPINKLIKALLEKDPDSFAARHLRDEINRRSK